MERILEVEICSFPRGNSEVKVLMNQSKREDFKDVVLSN